MIPKDRLGFIPIEQIKVSEKAKRRSTAANVYSELTKRELQGKPFSNPNAIKERIADLRDEKTVPVVVFNCIDFEWLDNPGSYPTTKAVINKDSITKFFQKDIQDIMQLLKSIGNSQLIIIIPDSELIDDRAFSFAQTPTERALVGEETKKNLETELQSLFQKVGGNVMYWSDYCMEKGIKSPLLYTTRNYEIIMANPKLRKKVLDQVKDSRKYFQRMGISADAPQKIMEKYITWYLAMYAGEGEALADSKALVLMHEDGRVPAWFTRGAEAAGKELAMIKPVNPLDYFSQRSKS